MNARWLRAVRTLLGAGLVIALALGAGRSAQAEDTGGKAEESSGKVMVQFAPDVIHFHSSDDYKGTSWLVGAEYIWKSRWLAGFAYFNNSFDQQCQYAYGGYSWVLTGSEKRHLYFKLTGGVLVGYRDPFADKIPLNDNGVGPGVIAGIGYQHDRFNVQVNTLGTAGVIITFGYDLFR